MIGASGRVVVTIVLALAGLAQSKPADGVDTTIARARAELAGGRAAEAEDVLWEALRASRDPRLLLALGDVLVERANGLDATSDLGQSLRTGVVEEARALYEEAAKTPDHAVDAAFGAATCHVM